MVKDFEEEDKSYPQPWDELLLTPEEIMETTKVPPEDYGAPPYWWLRANQRVAQAQLAKVQKHLVGQREKVARQLSVHKHEGISWDELPVNVKDFILKQADEIIAVMI